MSKQEIPISEPGKAGYVEPRSVDEDKRVTNKSFYGPQPTPGSLLDDAHRRAKAQLRNELKRRGQL